MRKRSQLMQQGVDIQKACGEESLKTSCLDTMETKEEQNEILDKLPLSKEEKEGLKLMWPKDVIHRIWDIILHHEDYNLSISLTSVSYVSDATERWYENVIPVWPWLT